MGADAPHRNRLARALLAYLAFVVYGSLVPFQYRPHTLEQAWQLFLAIPYLDLGVVSRADWVANLVLYAPLSFLACAWVAGRHRHSGPMQGIAAALVLAFCLALAVAVEFTQLFFAPRTVSLNDLLAETLGSLVGIGLWLLGRERLHQVWGWFRAGGRSSLLAAAIGYAAVYLALALFPYDFLISIKEFHWKLASDHNGWLLAGVCGDGLRCTARLAAEALALVPLGILLGLLEANRSLRYWLVAGCLLGLGLELAQLLVASGSSQGLSILTRGLGLMLGGWASRGLRSLGAAEVARVVGRWVPFALPLYLLLLLALNGWLGGAWLAPAEIAGRLDQVRLMPFYYHYYSTEPAALASLLANLGLYAPVGLAVWTGRWGGPWRGPGVSALAAALLSLLAELGKLGLASRHPDLTNPLIAAAGAAATFVLADWLGRVLSADRGAAVGGDGVQAVPGPGPVPAAAVHPEGEGLARPPSPFPGRVGTGRILAAGAAFAVAWGLLSYPVGGPWLALGLAVYGGLLWWRPSRWLLLLPALLPVLDFSPYTGRLLLDALDLLVLVTLAVGYWRLWHRPPRPWADRTARLAVLLLGATWAIATLRGLWPLDGGLALTSSHSPLEAWMVGKGLLWALLLLPLLRRVRRGGREAAQWRLVEGTASGLALVGLSVLWQRHLFVGLADFADVFRVTGTFSSMHTGGAYIEAFIAFAFPAQLVWVLTRRHRWQWVLGALLVAVSSYAMAVTFSRGGYAGLGVGLTVVAIGLLRGRAEAVPRRGLLLGGLVVVVLAAALPVLTGQFAQQRLARAAQDLTVRWHHWGRALGLMDDGPTAAALGMGFGQYPALYLWRAAVARPPATFSVHDEEGNPYLRLGAGETAYLDQVVALASDTRYRLTLKLRRSTQEARVAVPICEKALLYSFQCLEPAWSEEAGGGGWVVLSARVQTGSLGRGGNWPFRPVRLSLFNPGPGTAVDLDDVSLRGEDGRELLANGNFSSGIARWLFVTDQDLAWHIHQQELEMYFAQGLLGLGALLLLLVAMVRALVPALHRGRPAAVALAGGVAAFLTVGLLGSTMDTARLSLLFYLGCLGAVSLFGARRTA